MGSVGRPIESPRLMGRGPARPITLSFFSVQPGPARPITFSNISARSRPAHGTFQIRPVRPACLANDMSWYLRHTSECLQMVVYLCGAVCVLPRRKISVRLVVRPPRAAGGRSYYNIYIYICVNILKQYPRGVADLSYLYPS